MTSNNGIRCTAHPAYESDYCPRCGTATTIPAATDRTATIREARTEWSKARPGTAMAILAAAGSDMIDRRSILRAWGVSFDDQIDYSSDTFLRGCGFGPDGSELPTPCSYTGCSGHYRAAGLETPVWCDVHAGLGEALALPRRYAVTVNVRHNRTDGWASEFQLPTFYLDSNVQGIVSEEHAEKIARTIVDNMHVTGATYNITAVAL